jgi:hypothetical protein
MNSCAGFDKSRIGCRTSFESEARVKHDYKKGITHMLHNERSLMIKIILRTLKMLSSHFHFSFLYYKYICPRFHTARIIISSVLDKLISESQF